MKNNIYLEVNPETGEVEISNLYDRLWWPYYV